jgi:hypothetical protein
VCFLIIIGFFGTAFWLSAVGIFFKKKIKVYDISSTNVEIKVSAFEKIEEKIK